MLHLVVVLVQCQEYVARETAHQPPPAAGRARPVLVVLLAPRSHPVLPPSLGVSWTVWSRRQRLVLHVLAPVSIPGWRSFPVASALALYWPSWMHASPHSLHVYQFVKQQPRALRSYRPTQRPSVLHAGSCLDCRSRERSGATLSHHPHVLVPVVGRSAASRPRLKATHVLLHVLPVVVVAVPLLVSR